MSGARSWSSSTMKPGDTTAGWLTVAVSSTDELHDATATDYGAPAAVAWQFDIKAETEGAEPIAKLPGPESVTPAI
ncbi:hypothetical protein [Mesorhizobium sp. WSM4976]|uniref:hypothetical protein n=1 Tax=Mesorhizobium sp. WSM4976 TaxID=3038549 RepID=UPI003242A135